MLSRFCILAVLLFCPLSLSAQVPPKPSPTVDDRTKDGEILRIDTNLIQTGITVVDKKGNFVDGLKQSDFLLKVEGKPVATQFFDQISIRNPNAPGDIIGPGGYVNPAAVRDVPRTLVFVVDDLHLSAESLNRTRIMVLKFIDEQMMPTDHVAIVSSGGKVGFLQQFTSDKAMLRVAAKRLIFNGDKSSNDIAQPPMSEYEAQSIDRLDRDVQNYFIKETIRVYHMNNASQANSMVQARVRSILAQTAMVTSTTLSALEASVRASGSFRGRKAIYFITDGFLLDPGNSDTSDRLHEITNAAARSNTVIYSFDAKGLDASLPSRSDGEPPSPLLFSIKAGERLEIQDGPAYVANNTGGQFIHNTNDLQTALTRITTEAFTYYLLAWEPEAEVSKNSKFRRIEVAIKDRPDLKVRVQNGYLTSNPLAKKQDRSDGGQKVKDKVPSKDAAPVKNTVAASAPPAPATPPTPQPQGLDTSLTVSYLDLPDEGPSMSATVQVNTDAMDFTTTVDGASGNLEIKGTILNADGKQQKEFKVPVEVTIPSAEPAARKGVIYNYEHKEILKPGLYQIKVSTRDIKSGKAGSTFQWIDIPDLSNHKLALSSLLLGERKDPTNPDAELERNIRHQFGPSSSLRYLGFIYNAGADADLSIQAQILRQQNVVITDSAGLVSLGDKDPARLPFSGDLSLEKLGAGHYELKITVTDKKTKKTAIQKTVFEIN